jgi:type II secretory pathway component PulF
MMHLMTRSLMSGWEAIDKSGGTGANGKPMGFGEALGDMLKGYIPALLWPWGPIIVVTYLAIYILYRYFGSRVAKRFRHKVGLRYPVFGARARHECYHRFSWTMSHLAKSGLAPNRAWQLAADTIPNLEMRDMVANVGGRLHGAERLSDIISQSRLFPEEYGPVVATAEYTGDIPGAMEQLARISEGEFQSAQNYTKARSGCWGILLLFVTSGILLAMFWYTWYHELPGKVLEGMEP